MKREQEPAPRQGRWNINWKRELLETLAILGVALLVAGVWFGTHPQDWLRLRQSGAIPFLPTLTPRPMLVVVVATPTPTGSRLFTLYYDEDSFSLLNASGVLLEDVSPLTFERLDTSGLPQNNFSGQAWAGEQPQLQAGACARIEIEGQESSMRPAACSELTSLMTPLVSAEFVFWTSAPGSEAFRVLWQDAQVGVCQIAAGECSFYLP